MNRKFIQERHDEQINLDYSDNLYSDRVQLVTVNIDKKLASRCLFDGNFRWLAPTLASPRYYVRSAKTIEIWKANNNNLRSEDFQGLDSRRRAHRKASWMKLISSFRMMYDRHSQWGGLIYVSREPYHKAPSMLWNLISCPSTEKLNCCLTKNIVIRDYLQLHIGSRTDAILEKCNCFLHFIHIVVSLHYLLWFVARFDALRNGWTFCFPF